jgi:hypothetical protein
MTAEDWDAETDPIALLEYLYPMRGLDSTEEQTRSSRLYLLGCARLAWDRLPWVGQALVEVAERWVDREPLNSDTRYALREIAEVLTHCCGDPEELNVLERRLLRLDVTRLARRIGKQPSFEVDEWTSLAHLVYFPFAKTTPFYRRIAKADHSLPLFRDLFPNPLGPVRFRSEWQDRNVVSIARGMYESRDFSPMPVLADALQDAGCEEPAVLDHCRGPGPHFRGCWVLEGLLKKRR